MQAPSSDARVVVFAPPGHNAGLIAERLERAGIRVAVAPDLASFDALLGETGDPLGAVVVTSSAIRRGADAVIERFQEREPVWSALPIVLLAPAGAAPIAPWLHTTVLPQPTTSRLLVGVLRRALDARAQQYRVGRANVRLERMALRDALTGLPNRTALYERIQQLQRERRGHEGAFAALFLDVDDFKRVNDGCGHAVGDEALRQVAAHLVASVRATDLVARWGGDEFFILLVGADNARRVAETVRRLETGVTVHLETGEPLEIGLSVGLLDEIGPATSPDEILSAADELMYAHKLSKRRG